MSDDFVGRMSHFHSRNGLLDREKLTDRIEKLEAANLKASLITVDHLSRIEKLEAALRHCINALKQYEMGDDRPRGPIPNDDLRPWLLGAMDNAIKVLEGKDG